MYTAGSAVGRLFFSRAAAAASAGWARIFGYFQAVGIWGAVFAFTWLLPTERELLQKISPFGKGSARTLAAGALAGFSMLSLCALAAALQNHIRFSFASPDLLLTLAAVPGVLLRAGGEELLCRFYMQRRLRQGGCSPVFSVLVPALFFTAMHLGNRGITVISAAVILAAGILFALIAQRFGLYASVGFHFAWNYAQSHLWGLPCSGKEAVFSLFLPEELPQMSSFTFQPEFGAEGSLFALLLFLLADALLLTISKRSAGSGTV